MAIGDCYRTRVRSRLFALTAVAVVALVPAAQSSAHHQTTAPPPVVTIKVTISDSRIGFSQKTAIRGSYARFILHNIGKQPHAFALGATRRGTGVQIGFSKFLKPSEHKLLLLFLDYRGKVSYHATLPADRSKPGMQGVFTIK
jgi:hypothetical protein